MKFSIITPSYNSAATLEQTLQSIFIQTHADIEVIVIDGGSTDGTVDIIRKYADKIAYWVSENDAGIYDAMNKGIAHAKGDIIGILNSDDFYCSSNVLSDIARSFLENGCDMCYGNIVYVDAINTNKTVRKWTAGGYNEKKLSSGWIIPHPALFVKREVYEKYGAFRTDFRLAGDYEFMLRLLKVCHVIPAYVPKTFTCMREGGASASSLRQRMRGWRELRRAWAVNGLQAPPFFITRRVFSKLRQFL